MQSDNAVKTVEEQKVIRAAAQIIDDVYDLVLEVVTEGKTEKEIADFIEDKVLSLGGEGLSFDAIVAFGENGAQPHHVPCDRALKYGDLVTIDMGAVVNGYCSDFTRTFAYGEADAAQRKIYDIVYRAQKEAMAAVAVGESCARIDKIARDIIGEYGYDENYIHGTGHGVGKLIHEAPTLNPRSDEVLQKDMVITIEPGIYIEGEMGVRIEDMIIVGQSQPLSRHPRELIIVKHAEA